VALQVGELFAKLRLDDSEFNSKLSSAEGRFNSAAGAMGNATGFLSNMLSTAGGFVVGGIIENLAGQFANLAGGMISGNAQFETLEASFATLMGSTDRAREHLAMLAEFAATTPFELPEVAQASKLLLTFGGDALNTSENLSMVGNAAAATGNDIEGVAFWVGRAYSAISGGQPFGEAASELQTMGIMSAQTRQKLEELQAAGASNEEVWQAFTEQITAPSDAMQKLGETFTGRMSTLQDNLSLFSRTAGESLFAFAGQAVAAFNSPEIQAALQAFATNVNTFIGGVITWLVETAIPWLVAAWALFAPVVASAMTVLTTAFASVQTAVLGMSEIVSGVLATFAETIIGPLGSIEGLLGALGGGLLAFGALWAAPILIGAISSFGVLVSGVLAALLSPVAALIAIGAVFGSMWATNFMGVRDNTTAMLSAIGDAISTTIGFLGQVIADLAPAFQAFIGNMQGLAPAAAGIFNSILSIVQSVFSGIANTIGWFGPTMSNDLGTWFMAAQEIVSGVLAIILSVVQSVLSVVQGFISEHGASIANLFMLAWNTISDVINVALAIINGGIQSLSFVAAFIANHTDTITALFSGAWLVIQGVITGALNIIQGLIKTFTGVLTGDWNTAWEGIKQATSGVLEALHGVVGGALTALGGAINLAIGGIALIANSLGANISDGIVQGIQNGVQAIVDAAVSAASSALEAAKNFLGIKSPSREAAAQIGEPFVMGIVGGLEAMTPLLIDSVRTLGDEMLEELQAISDLATEIMMDSARSTLSGNKSMASRNSQNTKALQAMTVDIEKYQDALEKATVDMEAFADETAAGIDKIRDKYKEKLNGFDAAAFAQETSTGVADIESENRAKTADIQADNPIEAIDQSAYDAETLKEIEAIKLRITDKAAEELAIEEYKISRAEEWAKTAEEHANQKATLEKKLTNQQVKYEKELADYRAKREAEYLKQTQDVADQRAKMEQEIAAYQADRNADLADAKADEKAARDELAEQTALKNTVDQIAASARQELDTARKQAEEMRKYDADLAADYYNMRSKDILDLADLQKSIAEAQQEGDMQRVGDLSAQLELLRQEQDANAKLFFFDAQAETDTIGDDSTAQLQELRDKLRKELTSDTDDLTETQRDLAEAQKELAALKKEPPPENDKEKEDRAAKRDALQQEIDQLIADQARYQQEIAAGNTAITEVESQLTALLATIGNTQNGLGAILDTLLQQQITAQNTPTNQIVYNIQANYAYQEERTLRDDILLLGMLNG
jgi:phage-related protein